MPNVVLPPTVDNDGEIITVGGNSLPGSDPVNVTLADVTDTIDGWAYGTPLSGASSTIVIIPFETVRFCAVAAAKSWIVISGNGPNTAAQAKFTPNGVNGPQPLDPLSGNVASVVRTGVGTYDITLIIGTIAGVSVTDLTIPQGIPTNATVPANTEPTVWFSNIQAAAPQYTMETGSRARNGQFTAADFVGANIVFKAD